MSADLVRPGDTTMGIDSAIAIDGLESLDESASSQ
jgi:hypothetical protein